MPVARVFFFVKTDVSATLFPPCRRSVVNGVLVNLLGGTGIGNKAGAALAGDH
jgi:hypothetical protein